MIFLKNKTAISLGILGITLIGIVLASLLTQKPEQIQQHAAGNTIPSFQHIFLIMEENQDYNQIIGSGNAPYINSLVSQYGLAVNYHAITHPSLPNYIALTSGDTQGITTDCTTCFINANSIASQLEASGKTWKAYMEDMTTNCQLSDSGNYIQRHNPFVYYTNLRSSCQNNDVPYSHLSADLTSGTVPDLAWISPNIINDMHNGTVQQGDTWLSQEVPKILASPAFQQNGLLIITTDEGANQGTNQVATLMISPLVKMGYTSTIPYDHYSLLRTISDGLGITPIGQAAAAIPMNDFFGTMLPTITNSSPASSITQPQGNTPTPTISITPIPTGTISGTPSPTGSTPTSTISQGITPTTTPNPDILLNLSITLPGIGSINKGNLHPLHPLRQVQMTLYNVASGQSYQQKITMVFNGNYFSNPAIDTGSLPAGNYQIFMKTNGFLQLRLINTNGTNTFNLTPGTPFTLPPNEMIGGDMVDDNTLDLSDYNLLIGCYGLQSNSTNNPIVSPSISPTPILQPPTSSTCQNAQAADLDDNGMIDGIDYNILLKGLSQTSNGDIVPTQ